MKADSAGADLRESIGGALTQDKSMPVRRIDTITARLLHALVNAASDVDAAAVGIDSLGRAAAFLWALPDWVPLPDVVVESDGEIGFDWDEGPRSVISVSIGEGPMIKYAALLGSEPIHGRLAFAGSLPATLSFLLDRLYAGAAGRLSY